MGVVKGAGLVLEALGFEYLPRRLQ